MKNSSRTNSKLPRWTVSQPLSFAQPVAHCISLVNILLPPSFCPPPSPNTSWSPSRPCIMHHKSPRLHRYPPAQTTSPHMFSPLTRATSSSQHHPCISVIRPFLLPCSTWGEALSSAYHHHHHYHARMYACVHTCVICTHYQLDVLNSTPFCHRQRREISIL